MKKFLCACMLVSFQPMLAQSLDTLAVYELQTVQVVSTRAAKSTPMATTELSKEDISTVNHGKDIPQILSMQPAVTTTSDAGVGIGYTGIRVRGTDPTRINVTTNGIPLNDSESSQVYFVNLGDVASSMQSVQIQRGVGTSTNGAGAFGATINMQTENIGLSKYQMVDLAQGSYNSRKATWKFSTGLLNDHWGIQGRISNIHSDGYIDRAKTDLYSYFLQGAYFNNRTMLKFITFGGREQTYMAWDFASKADMKTFGRRYNPAGMYTDDNGQTAFYKNQTDNYTQLHNQLHLTHQASQFWSLSAALHYTYGNGYYEQYKTGQKLYKYHLAAPTDGTRSDLVREKKMRNHFYGTVFSANFDNHQGIVANIGGAWNYYDGDHFGNVIYIKNPSSSAYGLAAGKHYYDNNARKRDASVYGKIDYELLKGFHAYADIQYRHINYKLSGLSQEWSGGNQLPLTLDRSYHFLNPKAGLMYEFAKRHSLYFSYAMTHREPVRNDFEDRLAEASPEMPHHERLNDWEAGYRYNSPRFDAEVNLYRMNYDNQFVLTGAQDANGEMVARNIKDSYRMGIELSAAWRPTDNFEWSANATWSKNRAKNMRLTVINDDWSQQDVWRGSTPLAYSPSLIAGNVLKYHYKKWQAMLQTKFVSKQYMTNSGFSQYLNTDETTYTSAVISSFCTTDFDLNYNFTIHKSITATVGCTVYNLFCKRYESNGSCSMNYRLDANGNLEAYDGGWAWATYSAQAPTHFLAYINIVF